MVNSFRNERLATRKIRVKSMVARMAKTYGVKKSDLHDFLGCTKGLVNNWVYLGRVPYDYLEACSASKGVSLDWLLYGKASAKMLNTQDVQLLGAMHKQVLQDGVDYGLIKPRHEGAIAQMTDKFTRDLRRWTGAEQTSKGGKETRGTGQ
jgi:hypothetical protein